MIYSAQLARANRERAMEQVARGRDAWMNTAKWCVVEVANTHAQFTTDEVWALGLPPCPGSSRAMGPVMVAAAKAGYIERTDRTRNTTKAHSHAQPLRVWRSLIYGVQPPSTIL